MGKGYGLAHNSAKFLINSCCSAVNNFFFFFGLKLKRPLGTLLPLIKILSDSFHCRPLQPKRGKGRPTKFGRKAKNITERWEVWELDFSHTHLYSQHHSEWQAYRPPSTLIQTLTVSVSYFSCLLSAFWMKMGSEKNKKNCKKAQIQRIWIHLVPILRLTWWWQGLKAAPQSWDFSVFDKATHWGRRPICFRHSFAHFISALPPCVKRKSRRTAGHAVCAREMSWNRGLKPQGGQALALHPPRLNIWWHELVKRRETLLRGENLGCMWCGSVQSVPGMLGVGRVRVLQELPWSSKWIIHLAKFNIGKALWECMLENKEDGAFFFYTETLNKTESRAWRAKKKVGNRERQKNTSGIEASIKSFYHYYHLLPIIAILYNIPFFFLHRNKIKKLLLFDMTHL